MHELSFAHEILQVALDEAGHEGKPVREIRARITGPAHHFEPDSLAELVRIMARGTAAADARVNISIIPITLKCRACGNSFSERGNLACPRCGSTRLEETGEENIEIETVLQGE